MDVDPSRSRVPGHIGQRLLQDAEQIGRAVRVERVVVQWQIDLADDARAAGELLHRPLDRRREPQAVEHGGP